MPHSKFLSFLLLFLGLSFLAAAQNLTVTGNVRNSTGQGIEGITVLVKGTTEGTATKTDGSFLIHAPSNATLTLSV